MIDTAGYGKALFELAAENGSDCLVREELALIRTVLKENRSYVTLLDTPAVPTEEKQALLRQAFGAVDPMLLNFLSLLCEKRSFYLFFACADAYDGFYDEAHNPKLIIMIVSHNTCVSAAYKRSRELSEANGFTLINFVAVFENRMDYIVNRLHQYL